jgi:hypothetical protein
VWRRTRRREFQNFSQENFVRSWGSSLSRNETWQTCKITTGARGGGDLGSKIFLLSNWQKQTIWIHNHNHGAELVKQLMKKNKEELRRLCYRIPNWLQVPHTHIAHTNCMWWRDVVVGGGAQWALNLVVAQSSMACLQKDYLHTTHINGMHARDIPFLSLSLSLSLSSRSWFSSTRSSLRSSKQTSKSRSVN